MITLAKSDMKTVNSVQKTSQAGVNVLYKSQSYTTRSNSSQLLGKSELQSIICFRKFYIKLVHRVALKESFSLLYTII